MDSAKTLYQKLRDITRDTPVAVATIVRVRGSVPREVGTKMIIHPLGQHYGTVGGGCGEADVIKVPFPWIRTSAAGISYCRCGGIALIIDRFT